MCRIAWSCIMACAASVIGDILLLAVVGMFRKDSVVQNNWNAYKELDPALIRQEWDFRADQRPLETAAGLFNAAAWIILCIPLLHTTWKLSLNGTHLIGLHAAIAVLTITGAVAEFVAHMMVVGSLVTMEWLSTDFNLDYWVNQESLGDQPDDIGWRVLELTWISIRGLLLWVSAVEWLFLAVILLLLFISIQRQQLTPSTTASGTQTFCLSWAFGGFSLFLSMVSLIDFAFEVLRFKDWKAFTQLAFIIAIISRLILWPIWYLWLGRQVARPLPVLQPPALPQDNINYGGGESELTPSEKVEM